MNILNFFIKGDWVFLLLFLESIGVLALITYLAKTLFFTISNNEQIYDLNISRKIGWLSHLASLSTLTGLLGTVLGIYSSFQNIQNEGKISIEVFASGISTALVTTIYGLSIAIPSIFFHHIFYDKLEQKLEDSENLK